MMSFLHHTRAHTHSDIDRGVADGGIEGEGTAHVEAAVDFGQISANTSCFQLRDETCATNLQFGQNKIPKIPNCQLDSHDYLYSCLSGCSICLGAGTAPW